MASSVAVASAHTLAAVGLTSRAAGSCQTRYGKGLAMFSMHLALTRLDCSPKSLQLQIDSQGFRKIQKESDISLAELSPKDLQRKLRSQNEIVVLE
jgi:hypothetical protein